MHFILERSIRNEVKANQRLAQKQGDKIVKAYLDAEEWKLLRREAQRLFSGLKKVDEDAYVYKGVRLEYRPEATNHEPHD